VPKLATDKPFVRLDPRRIDPERYWEAASPEGALALGRAVRVDEVGAIDLVVTGSVAAARDGARLGKGGGFTIFPSTGSRRPAS
jgi:5-formyltetrahydrofolate cyclo-ligase